MQGEVEVDGVNHMDCTLDLFSGMFIPAWIDNHMFSKVCDEITYPFRKFNGCDG